MDSSRANSAFCSRIAARERLEAARTAARRPRQLVRFREIKRGSDGAEGHGDRAQYKEHAEHPYPAAEGVAGAIACSQREESKGKRGVAFHKDAACPKLLGNAGGGGE